MIVALGHHRHRNTVVGNGQCVAYVQAVSKVGHTSNWRRGVKARGGNLPAGAIIATFSGDPPRYQNLTDGSSHAAVMVREEAAGLRVLDQWHGQPVHERLIAFRGGQGKPVNDGDAYYAVTHETGDVIAEGRKPEA